MSDHYDKLTEWRKGYRAGVMAERRRAMLVALRATNKRGNPSEEGHSLAHRIGQAGDQIPAQAPEEPEEWSVFGERRLVRTLPTALERASSPFTRAGLRYISRLEEKHYGMQDAQEAREALLEDQEDMLHIEYLKEKLADAPERIEELEKLVETLSLQLAGVID